MLNNDLTWSSARRKLKLMMKWTLMNTPCFAFDSWPGLTNCLIRSTGNGQRFAMLYSHYKVHNNKATIEDKWNVIVKNRNSVLGLHTDIFHQHSQAGNLENHKQETSESILPIFYYLLTFLHPVIIVACVIMKTLYGKCSNCRFVMS